MRVEVSLWKKKREKRFHACVCVCGKLDVSLSLCLCLSLRKLKQRDTTGGWRRVHTWMNRHTDGCVRAAIRYVSLSRSLSGVVALCNTLCFHARARAGYVFAYSSARVNVVNYISRSSLTCKHQTR